MQREVLAVQQLKLGAEHPDTLWTAGHLANSLSKQGQNAEAEKMHRQVLAAQKRVLGEAHPDTLFTACNLTRPACTGDGAARSGGPG